MNFFLFSFFLIDFRENLKISNPETFPIEGAL